MKLHGCRAADSRTASPASSRAPAIPARTATRSRSRPTRPRRSRAALARSSRRAADRPRRPRQPAARSRPVPVRPRHRHRPPRPSKAALELVDPEEPPHRRRPRRRLPRRATRSSRSSTTAPPRRRVGLQPEGRAPVREGVPLFADATSTDAIGSVTSGGFGPSARRADRHGLPAQPRRPADGTTVFAELRGQRMPMHVAAHALRPRTATSVEDLTA